MGRTRTKTLASSKSPATRRIVTSFVLRRCVTSPYNQPSSTTAASGRRRAPPFGCVQLCPQLRSRSRRWRSRSHVARGPIEPVLARIDPRLATPLSLTDDEFRWLVDFVRAGLLDKRARPERFRKLIPETVPSGRPTLMFQFEDRPDIQ